MNAYELIILITCIKKICGENKINIPYTFKRAEYSIIPIVFNAVHLYSPPSSVRTRDIFKWLITSPELSTYWPIAYLCNDETSIIGWESRSHVNYTIESLLFWD